jgi:hypothetical protein
MFLDGPRIGSGGSGHTMVSPLAEKGSSRVIEIIDARGKIGTSSEVADEFFPGGRRVKITSQLFN